MSRKSRGMSRAYGTGSGPAENMAVHWEDFGGESNIIVDSDTNCGPDASWILQFSDDGNTWDDDLDFSPIPGPCGFPAFGWELGDTPNPGFFRVRNETASVTLGVSNPLPSPP